MTGGDLLRVAGLDPSQIDRNDIRSELVALLTRYASHFLEGGGSFSLSEWADLYACERVALASAGKARAVKQALRVGQAAQGSLEALRVKAEIDGGESHDDEAIRATVIGVQQGLKGLRGRYANT